LRITDLEPRTSNGTVRVTRNTNVGRRVLNRSRPSRLEPFSDVARITVVGRRASSGAKGLGGRGLEMRGLEEPSSRVTAKEQAK